MKELQEGYQPITPVPVTSYGGIAPATAPTLSMYVGPPGSPICMTTVEIHGYQPVINLKIIFFLQCDILTLFLFFLFGLI